MARAIRGLLRTELDRLVTAQFAHLDDAGTYSSTLAALQPYYQAETGVTITIAADWADGWSAIAVHDQLPDAKCVVFMGTADPPIEEATFEAEPACVGFPTRW